MRVYLTLDKQACIIAGQEKFGTVSCGIDLQLLTEEERQLVAPLYVESAVRADGTREKGIDLTREYLSCGLVNNCNMPRDLYPALTEANLEGVKQIVATRLQYLEADKKLIAEREAKLAVEQEKYIAEAIENGSDPNKWVEQTAWGWSLKDRVYPMGQIASDLWQSRILDHPAIAKARQDATQIIEDKKAAKAMREQQEALAEAEEEKAKREASQRRIQQLATWVQEKCSDSDKRRFAKGLMPEDEIVGMIRTEAFSVLRDFDRLTPLKRSDIEEAFETANEDEDGDYTNIEYCRPMYTTRTPDGCAPAVFARMEQIEQLISGAQVKSVKLIEHVGYFEEYIKTNDPEANRLGIKVTMQVGELTLSREYAAE